MEYANENISNHATELESLRDELACFTDTQGNAVTYEYDEMSRVTKVTPTQGTNYRTEYSYNKNGSLSQVKTYDAGTGSDTDYSYNTTSGKLSYRDYPTVSSTNIRTTYSYDSAGRLQYETVTRETGSTTNLYRTGYAYSYPSYHRQVVRTEQEPLMAAWEDKNRVTYKYDGMERSNESQARMPAPLVARGLDGRGMEQPLRHQPRV